MELYYNKTQCVCLPFKVILGNFIEALQMGMDSIMMGVIKGWSAGAISASATGTPRRHRSLDEKVP